MKIKQDILATKIYFSIAEVSNMLGISESKIRFWEKQFSIISPKRNTGNRRIYTKKDIDNLKLIYHLREDRNLTINGVKIKLKESITRLNRDQNIIDRLKKIKKNS